MTTQKEMTNQIKRFNKKIKEGYKVDWKNTKQIGNKTIIAMTK